MNVLNFDYDIEHGFAWITLDNKMTIQVCIDDHKKVIKKTDCGHNWGLSGDNNEAAFEAFGEDECIRALFLEAGNNDFELI